MKRSTLLVSACVAVLLLAGCAPTKSAGVTTQLLGLPRPDRIVVYPFAITPQEVQLDRGVGSRLATLVRETPPTAEQEAIGQRVAEALATRLLQELWDVGYVAQQGPTAGPLPGRTLSIRGQFLAIDEGNRTRRVVIGLGAGHSIVRTAVQLGYTVGATPEQRVMTFETEARSGYKPGMAATMGVGGATGRVAESAVLSAGLTGVSETWGATVDADARRTAKEIVQQLKNCWTVQGW